MRKLRLTGVAGLAIAAALIPAAGADAKQTKSACPKSWSPVPTQALPPGSNNKDNNMNFVVCAKGPQGSNNHFNVKDDRTNNVVLPAFWNSVLISQEPLQDVWLAMNNLDSSPNYFLDPAPVDWVDDVELP